MSMLLAVAITKGLDLETEKNRREKIKKSGECCQIRLHPDHSEELPRIRRASGQVTALERMIQERRYCPDIIVQLKAAGQALKAAELSILRRHLHSCVKTAMEAKSRNEAAQKIDEIVKLLN